MSALLDPDDDEDEAATPLLGGAGRAAPHDASASGPRRRALWFFAGLSLGLWATIALGPMGDTSPSGAGRPEPQAPLVEPGGVRASPPVRLDANATRFAECVRRVAPPIGLGPREGSTPATLPSDIVLAVMTTHKRHGLVEMLRAGWLSETKTFFLTDGPGLMPSELHRVGVYEGDPQCGASDRAAPTIHFANASWWGEFKWLLMVDDDVIVSTANLAAFLSAYDADDPLWFSAHGCDPSYSDPAAADAGTGADSSASRAAWPHGASCVAIDAPKGSGDVARASRGLRGECAARGGAVRELDRPFFKGECGALGGVQGLKTYGSKQGMSYCGGTGCAFSRGYLRRFGNAELLRKGSACAGCTRGQQDVVLSRCLFRQNAAAVAPIGVPGFFWGRPAERLVELLIERYPACVRARGADDGAAGACARALGMGEWFSLHLQVRGAFTTLYGNLTPATWSGLRHTSRKPPIPVTELLSSTWNAERALRAVRDAERATWASRLCCALVHTRVVPCMFGCVPWRLRPMPRCATPAGPAPAGVAAGFAFATFDSFLWPRALPAGESEVEMLKVQKKQFWPDGPMKCELCDGHFNGWRGT